MVANDAKLVAKNDANLDLPPRFRQVLIESPPIITCRSNGFEQLYPSELNELIGILANGALRLPGFTQGGCKNGSLGFVKRIRKVV
ncbi:hypothetical protein TNCV_2130601 [Trichonephila clavipes]|nr:hypothetical protein TNCV_2130601 [Trichonephila clavipes]